MPIYMNYEGIVLNKGNYKGWIELESCQIAVHRNVTSSTGNGTNREAATPTISEIIVTKMTDSNSTALFKESLTGKGKKVTIDFVKQGETLPYLSIELENTLVTSYSISGHRGSSHDKPMESLSLNFTKITYSTTPTTPSKDPKHAAEKATWDTVTK